MIVSFFWQGLASCYLNLPQETKTKFIKTPQVQNLGLGWIWKFGRVYRTKCGGSLVRCHKLSLSTRTGKFVARPFEMCCHNAVPHFISRVMWADIARTFSWWGLRRHLVQRSSPCQDNLLEFVGRLDNQVGWCEMMDVKHVFQDVFQDVRCPNMSLLCEMAGQAAWSTRGVGRSGRNIALCSRCHWGVGPVTSCNISSAEKLCAQINSSSCWMKNFEKPSWLTHGRRLLFEGSGDRAFWSADRICLLVAGAGFRITAGFHNFQVEKWESDLFSKEFKRFSDGRIDSYCFPFRVLKPNLTRLCTAWQPSQYSILKQEIINHCPGVVIKDIQQTGMHLINVFNVFWCFFLR